MKEFQNRFKNFIKSYLDYLPYVRTLKSDLEKYRTVYPPGHYYSPVPSQDEVFQRTDQIFSDNDDLLGIDLDLEEQCNYLKRFSKFQETTPFYDESVKIRYDIDNDTFRYDDGPILHFMLRDLEPRHVIEIGVGNSSLCMLDTNESYLGNKTTFTFIDPNCTFLRSKLLDRDNERTSIIESQIQDVDLQIFRELKANDILFIDSSHVVKIGSDVNWILFHILPRLAPGVYIHFHDIRYPFQYFEPFIRKGYYWNEAYALRAFLQYNDSFKIVFWLNFLLKKHPDLIRRYLASLPVDANDKYAGGSIWLVAKETNLSSFKVTEI